MKSHVLELNKVIFGCITLFAMIIGFGSYSHAVPHMGLFVEPAVTYEVGSSSVNYPAPLTSSTGQLQGFGLAARLGFHLDEAFFLGLDGRFAQPKFTDDGAEYSATSVSSNWGPVVGMQMPNLGMRIWASYVMGGDLDPENSSGFDVRFKGGKGYRIGAGFRIETVSLNLEYQQLQYGDTGLEKIGPFTAGSNLSGVNLESRTWIASVSFPLELM